MSSHGRIWARKICSPPCPGRRRAARQHRPVFLSHRSFPAGHDGFTQPSECWKSSPFVCKYNLKFLSGRICIILRSPTGHTAAIRSPSMMKSAMNTMICPFHFDRTTDATVTSKAATTIKYNIEKHMFLIHFNLVSQNGKWLPDKVLYHNSPCALIRYYSTTYCPV